MTDTVNFEEAARLIALKGEDPIVLLLGATDTGKSTFISDCAVGRGRSAGLVDGDIGQTQIGLPGTVTGAVISGQGQAGAGRWSVASTAFVGATSPVRRLPEWLAAIAIALRDLRRQAPLPIFVDTPGWVAGALAQSAHRALAQLIEPDVVLLFERDAAANPLRALFRGLDAPQAIAVASPPDVRRKSASYRKSRRTSRFQAYFEASGEVALHGDQVDMIGDMDDSGGCVDLLCGLHDSSGRYLGAGLVQRWDPSRRLLRVLTPLKETSPIRQAILGSVRVRRDGVELGDARGRS